MSSIITTGINIVATGVNSSISQVKRFGQALTQTERQVNRFARGYNRQQQQMFKSDMGLSAALNRNWRDELNATLRRNGRDMGKALKSIEQQYDRTFRNIGNKYQSMVMGSVALSMSGIGIKNAGMNMLGAAKSSLDVAKDFELTMKQIQFYGHRTAGEMTSIQQQIIKLGYDLPVTTSEVANSVLEAQKLGYDKVTDAMKMAKEASKIQFMGLGKINGEESLKYISQFRQLTGTTIGDVDTLTDKLSKTADVSAASIDSLWKTIQSSRTAYDSLGADVDTFLTLTGTLADRLTPRNAGMALNSFAGGVQMAEKARREYQANPNSKMTRGKNYNTLIDAMGGKDFDAYKGDVLKFVEDVAVKSKKIWGTGSERKGNLQSIFGKSAVDLFYAIDSAMKKTGKSMHGIRDEIEKSGGHAEKYMDAIMNTSYGTEMKLQAVKEQFQILFGQAIRPMFNQLLTGIEKVLGAINKFIANHPKLTKVLGYGFGIAGLLLTATGASMMFVGGILAIYASLANLFVQLARNTRVLNLLSSGYSTAGAMIKAQMMGPLSLLGKSLLRISGITFFLYLAWKNDFLRMRTKFNEWKTAIGRGLKASEAMFVAYKNNSVASLNEAFALNRQSGLDGWVANTWTKAKMLWDGIKDIWKDGTISVEKYQMLKDAGLLPYIESVYKWKTRISDFWKGFQDGMKEGIRLLKDLVKPLKPIWEWVSSKVLALFQHFGYFKETGKGVGSIWQQAGEKLGYIVGSVVAIRLGLWAWLRAAKLVISPFKMIYGITKKIAKTLDKFKDFGKMMKGLGKFAFKMAVPKPLRRWMGYGTTRGRQRAMGPGASSPVPQARRVIDPTTGRPTGQVTYQRPQGNRFQQWRQERRLNRERRRGNGSIRQGQNGVNNTRRARGLGRVRDFFRGEVYLPEERVDRRGRTYHQVRTSHGVTRTNAQGQVRGQYIRSDDFRTRTRNRINNTRQGMRSWFNNARSNGPGTRLANRVNNNRVVRRTRGFATLANMINFNDAGMDYQSSVGQRGHRRRSVRAGVRGFINRSRRQGISAGGNSLASQMMSRRGEINALGGGGARGGARGGGRGIGGLFRNMFRGGGRGLNLASIFKGALKGVTKLGPSVGKGLLKGLGMVVKRGIPLLFKVGLRAIPILGEALLLWDAIKFVFTNWDAIKSAARTAWNWIKTTGVSLLGTAWTWIKTKAGEVWNWIKTKASGVWTGIKTTASSLMTALWSAIKSKASEVWGWVKSKAKGAWDYVKTTASGIWGSIVSGAKTALANMFQPIKDAWDSAKKYVTNNPITQTVKKVVKTVIDKVGGGGKKGKGARTGEWYVPKDNMPYNLHAGEMVLTRKEAQIMRSLIGSDNNSISKYLLERASNHNGSEINIASTAKRQSIKPMIKVKTSEQSAPQVQQGGNVEIKMEEGAVQIHVANASASEMKKATKQIYAELKRLMELDNMKNYRPARPRTR